MTLRAVAGLVALHGAFAVVGTSLLFALGWRTAPRSVLPLVGLAHLMGVASLGVVWTLLLVLGAPFGVGVIVVTALVVAGAALAAGRRRAARVRPGESAGGRLGIAAVVTGAGVLAAGAYLAWLFRVARVEGVFSFDGWAFWVTRGKAIYYFGGLDEQVFATVPHPSYPPVIPILDAAAFHAMGSADVVTLHVHYWLLAVGFVAAVAGLLARRVPAWILWPSLLLALVLPRVRSSTLAAQADLPLDYLIVTAAILVALWLVDRQAWQLGSAAVLLAGAGLVKREGLVLAACVLAAGLLASVRTRRRDWRPLLLVGLGVAAAIVPWRLWHAAKGIEGETGTGGLDTLLSQRTVDSVRLALEVLVSDRFSLIPTVGLVAVVLAAVWGRRRHALYVASLVGLLTLAGASTSVVFPEIAVTADEAVNPIVRLTVATVLSLSCLTPLLLAGVWTSRASASEE